MRNAHHVLRTQEPSNSLDGVVLFVKRRRSGPFLGGALATAPSPGTLHPAPRSRRVHGRLPAFAQSRDSSSCWWAAADERGGKVRNLVVGLGRSDARRSAGKVVVQSLWENTGPSHADKRTVFSLLLRNYFPTGFACAVAE